MNNSALDIPRIQKDRDDMMVIIDKYKGYLAGFVNVTAELTEDVEMRVWNRRHGAEYVETKHIASKGTRVLIWMNSRFGDFGITDNTKNPCLDDGPCGYDARVTIDKLTNIQDNGNNWE
jgi:hypothetical protein